MRNMKTLLRLLGAVSLSTVAASSVVACGSEPDNNVKMDTQVKKDFGFLDENGQSKISLTIQKQSNDEVSWNSKTFNGITADNLLATISGESAKAKSAAAANFLVNVLKLNATGKDADRIFKHSEAQAIKMNVKEYAPTVAKIDTTDYAVTGGTVTIKFEKENIQLGDNYSLDILGQPKQGLVESILPTSISNNNFNAIPDFEAGKPKSNFPVGTDLTQYFKTDDKEGKTVKSIVDLIKQGDLKIKVSEAAEGTGDFAKGNTIKVKISIGEVQFTKEETLFIQ